MSAAAQLPEPRPLAHHPGDRRGRCRGPDAPPRAPCCQTATLVVGGARHLALAAPLIHGERLAWPSPMTAAFPAILARRGAERRRPGLRRPLLLTASAPRSPPSFPPARRFCLPAPSAFSLACARLGWAMQDVATLSFCGRPLPAILPHLQPGARILALSADASTPASARRPAARARLRPLAACICWKPSAAPRERIRTTAPTSSPAGRHRIRSTSSRSRSRPDPARASSRSPAAGRTPSSSMTASSPSAKSAPPPSPPSRPRAGELLWDIGCGSGSVAIEWSLRHPAKRAIAIEARPDRADARRPQRPGARRRRRSR